MSFKKPEYLVHYCSNSKCKTIRHFRLKNTNWNTGVSIYQCSVCGLRVKYDNDKVEVMDETDDH